MASQSSSGPARLVIEGVPRVRFYEGGPRCPEDFCLSSSLRALMEHLGESLGCQHVKGRGSVPKVECAYAYLMGITGEAFQLFWSKDWADAHPGHGLVPVGQIEGLARAFEAVGHAYEAAFRGQLGFDETTLRGRVIASIAAGRPALGFGVVGPPEPGLISGYDDGGDVLIGWDFFQGAPEFSADLEFEPSGYYRQRKWASKIAGLVTIGDKVEKPPLGEVARKALRRALEIMCTPTIKDGERELCSGLAAYMAWADALRPDGDFPRDNLELLRKRHMMHDDAVGIVAEGRWYGSVFLRQIGRQEPEMAPELKRAADCLAVEHDLMWALWYFLGGMGRTDEQARKIAEPFLRERMVPIILLSREKDEEAADCIERALAR